MVNARASGITFTVDPVTADDSKILLEANWGLGEGVVSGAESVDGFVVDKESLEILARHVGNKVKCVVYTKDGADWADVPEHMQNMPCISDEEIVEIARVAKVCGTESRGTAGHGVGSRPGFVVSRESFLATNASGQGGGEEEGICIQSHC